MPKVIDWNKLALCRGFDNPRQMLIAYIDKKMPLGEMCDRLKVSLDALRNKLKVMHLQTYNAKKKYKKQGLLREIIPGTFCQNCGGDLDGNRINCPNCVKELSKMYNTDFTGENDTRIPRNV
jgi:predicted Zn-ribbon and HTH transcriptional regulator